MIHPEFDFAPALEVDARYRERVNFFLQLKDPDLRKAHDEYNRSTQTLSSLMAIGIFLSMFTLSFTGMALIHLEYLSIRGTIPAVFLNIIVMVIATYAAWRMFFHGKNVISKNGGSLPPKFQIFLQKFQKVIYLTFLLAVSARHLARCMSGQCPYEDSYVAFWDCNPVAESYHIPTDTAVVIMLIPLFYSVAVRGAHFGYCVFLWLVSIAMITLSIYLGNGRNSFLFLIYYTIPSGLMLVENRRQNYCLFFTYQKLQEILHERQRQADEENATEMRHMIANVAHDLKTPLASFLGGIEYISHVIRDAQTKEDTSSLSKVDIADVIQCITQCVTNMRNTNSFMLMTINRCIDFTKASKGVGLVPKYETVDVVEALALPLSCMKDIQQRIPIVLDAVCPTICTHIITDKQWLQENVLCLLSNAVKYSNEGLVRVAICLIEKEAPSKVTDETENDTTASVELQSNASTNQSSGDKRGPTMLGMIHHSTLADLFTFKTARTQAYLRVEVEDHGIGLSEEAMVTLFSPFKQAQRLAGGTGLGLFSLAKRLEALEGKCGVQKRRDGGEGSLFWFEIPYRPDLATATLGTESPPSPARPEEVCPMGLPLGATSPRPASLSGSPHPTLRSPTPHISIELPPLRILVVDDSPAILKMTTMMLKRYHHVVHTATNGAEAVKMVQEMVESSHVGGFDVILMDLQMPVMDGLEATKRLRGLEARSNVDGDSSKKTRSDMSTTSVLPRQVIIGVSANSDSTTTAEAYRMGVDGFMAKPFELNTFYTTYQKITSKPRHDRGI